MRKVIRLGMRLMLLIGPMFLICSIAIAFFPMKFYDGEYAWYKENKEYAKHHTDYCRALIMGDSAGKAAWQPETLSKDTYNYALGGASPAEEYYYLREYLKYNEKPEYVLYTQGAAHFLEAGTLWSRSAYFHRIDWRDLRELLKVMDQYGGVSDLETGSEKEIFLYRVYSPDKYSNALIKGLLHPSRKKENIEKYNRVLKDRGYTQFGTAEYCDDVNYYAEYEAFEVNKAMDYYFCKIIELCLENQIQFVFQNPPLNESTYEKLKPRFVDEYTSYLKKLQENYPSAIIDTDLVSYKNRCFGDATHLNTYGSKYFSKQMKEKYKNIFDRGKV